MLLFFLLRGVLPAETLSWVCILAAAPFAAAGFVRYQGMSALEFLKAFLKTELLEPKRYLFSANDLYWEICRDTVTETEKKGGRRHGRSAA